MPPEQLDQIAEIVRNNLLNHLDREIEWQSLVDLILA